MERRNPHPEPGEDNESAHPGEESPSDSAASEDQRKRELDAWAKRVVDSLPPLTQQQRERLALLLRTTR